MSDNEFVTVRSAEDRRVIINEGGQLAADRITELEQQLEDALSRTCDCE